MDRAFLDNIDSLEILNNLIIPVISLKTLNYFYDVTLKKTLKKNVFIINGVLCDFNKKNFVIKDNLLIANIENVIYIGYTDNEV